MRNPVAHEVQVIATGARPGADPAKRELFSETTSTVLVFENGAVISLSAAVVTGQLIFLTNQQSKREVVAQVLKKRSFRPTSCYVELQFTEPAPGFWGIEFPQKPEPATPDSHQAKTVKLVQGAEITGEIRKKHAAAAGADEVGRLKRQVEGLREQLESLKQLQAPSSGTELAPALPSPTPSDPPLPKAESAKDVALGEPENKTEKSASSANSEQHSTDAAPAPGPSRAPLPRASSSWSPALLAQERKAGGLSRARFAVLSVVLVIVSCGVAYYMHWLPLPEFLTRDQESKAQIAGAGSRTKTPGVQPSVPAVSSTTGVTPDAPSTHPPETSSTPQANAAPAPVPSDSPGSNASASESGRYSSASPTDATDALTPSVASAKHLRPRQESREDRAATPSTVSVASPEIPGVVPPRLLHSARPVPPPDAVRDFVTGNVKVDALVDASGHVKSVSVLAGPESLRGAALEAVKQYKYAPATRNSTPVSAHVTVSVQFWYEP